MIRAIIFDCFGVLTSDGWLPFKEEYFGDDKQRFDEATSLNHQSGAGMLSEGDFLEQVADLAHISPQQAAQRINDGRTNTRLFDYIEQKLKPHYKIGLLSNAGANNLAHLFTPHQIALFNEIGLSYEIGAVKPDKKAYMAILEKLQVEADAAVFIDDQERHCTGARDVGMKAIVYQDYEQTKKELEQILGDTEN